MQRPAIMCFGLLISDSFQQVLALRRKAVFLEAAVRFIGDRALDEVLLNKPFGLLVKFA